MAKVKARKTPIDPTAKKMTRGQQDELEVAKRTEAVLWAMYAMCGGHMSKGQRERYNAILKKMVDGVWHPSLTEMWIKKGLNLKADVLDLRPRILKGV